MDDGLFVKIERLYPQMSKSQKKISDFIRQYPEQAAFMTANKLGRTVDVSESSAVRFAMFLGFDGYPEFQKELSLVVKTILDEKTVAKIAYHGKSQSDIINSVLASDMQKISDTLAMVDGNAFNAAIDILDSAKNIYIIGIRADAPLAAFLAFYLNIMFGNVHLLQTTSMSEIFEQMIRVGEEDAVIGISFPRYSMRTLKALEFANSRSAKVIAITDNVLSPVSMYSSCNLLAKTDSISIVDSIVAPMSLVNALIVALSIKRQSEIQKNVKALEKIWDDYQSHGLDELDPIIADSIEFEKKADE